MNQSKGLSHTLSTLPKHISEFKKYKTKQQPERQCVIPVRKRTQLWVGESSLSRSSCLSQLRGHCPAAPFLISIPSAEHLILVPYTLFSIHLYLTAVLFVYFPSNMLPLRLFLLPFRSYYSSLPIHPSLEDINILRDPKNNNHLRNSENNSIL